VSAKVLCRRLIQIKKEIDVKEYNVVILYLSILRYKEERVMNDLTAIIPVKKNSNRLPNRNILPFGNSNLPVHNVRQLKQSGEIDGITISSDSEKMLDIGIAYVRRIA
jgi:hypothetical protein